MSAIHIILQGKGGVGKSLVAALLAQYLEGKGDNKLFCADTDPVNDTFARYSAFGAERVKILNADKNIDSRVFDGLIEKLLEHEGDAVIDNGASTFIPLSAYMLENNVVGLLQEAGKQVYIHTVVTGGQSADDTMIGLKSLIMSQSAPIVVWQNEFFGAVEKDGKTFFESKLYENHQHRIKGIVTIHKRNQDTFGKDLELMISNKLTFSQAMTSDLFTIMPRQRLKQIQKSIYTQLDNALQNDGVLLN
jgi:cellulose biosynthesis protein BcsQ